MHKDQSGSERGGRFEDDDDDDDDDDEDDDDDDDGCVADESLDDGREPNCSPTASLRPRLRSGAIFAPFAGLHKASLHSAAAEDKEVGRFASSFPTLPVQVI